MGIPPPTNLGHYEILSKLGAGGMGEVYLARDKNLDRLLALKVLPAEVSNDKQRRMRFTQEAKAASALNHPNIAHIYEISEVEGVSFIAMEYVEGQSLDQRLAHPISCSEIIQIGHQAADALAQAHTRRIIHRDIKSSNIMLTPRGQVKILDFGLAKFQHTESSGDQPTQVKTEANAILGTVPYMSPEQALGKAIDHRSDIFSLGVVLYQLVTGRLPFSGKTAPETLNFITNAEPEAMARFNYDVPAELERIIRKCLEKDRERRYQSAADLVVDLKNLQRDSQSSVPLASPKVTKTPGRVSGLGLIVIAVVALSITSITGFYWYRRSEKVDRGLVPQTVRSIAVLPFANSNGNQNSEYLSDGITESIINSLSQLPSLRVMARTTMFRYKGKEVDPQIVGRDLQVDAVLTGRVLQQNNTLVIQADLMNVSDGSQLWGEHYTRKLDDVFAIQDEIAKQITDRLRLRLTGEEQKLVTKHPTENTEAYDLYLKGRYFWGKGTEDGFKKSIEYYQQATALDPNYALAYVGIASSYASLGGVLGFQSPTENYPKSKEFAMRALALDETLAEAHSALATNSLNYEWNWPEAEQQYKRAIELNPNYGFAHSGYGTYLEALGRFDEAVRERQLAQKCDPLSPFAVADVGYPLYYAGQYDEAIKYYRRGLELDPKFSWGHLWIGQVYVQRGMYNEAIDEINQAIQLSGGDTRARATLGHAFAVAGRRDDAVKVLNELKSLSKERYVSPYFMALIYVGLGDDHQAVAWLEKAYAERQPYLILMKAEPVFNRLHADPGFQAIERRVGLAP